MPKKTSPNDNRSNTQNPDKGIPATNKQHDKAQGNRGPQKNSNRSGGKGKK